METVNAFYRSFRFIGRVIQDANWLIVSGLGLVPLAGEIIQHNFEPKLSRVEIIDTSLESITLVVIGLYISHRIVQINQLRKSQEESIRSLRQQAEEIKVLQGIIPICAKCHAIRDDEGIWHQLEAYLTNHADVMFSHGLCAKCVRELYPEFADEFDQESGSETPTE